MEISKQNYLIDQQIFATTCYLSHFSYLHMGIDINFLNFCYKEGVTLSQVAKLHHNKD